MAYHQGIVNLNGGEYSPILDSRIDLAKYSTGHQLLENFLITPSGAIIRRPGTEYMGRAKRADKKCLLWGFNFSTTTTFVLEIGEFYIRFWSNGFPVTKSPGGVADWVTATAYDVGDYVIVDDLMYYCDANHTSGVFADDLAAGRWTQQTALELPAPWTADQLYDLQFQAINDLIYIVHPDVSIRKLRRIADDNWAISEISWTFPPTLPENTANITIAASATTGTVTLTASSAIFEEGHEGSWWNIGHRRGGEGGTYVDVGLTNVSETSGGIFILGNWELTTFGTWQGTLFVQRLVPGTSSWENIRTYFSSTLGQRNVNATGNEEQGANYRLVFTTAGVAGTNAVARLEVGESKYWGSVQITNVNSPTSATATVKRSLWATTATLFWAEAAFSNVQGHPRSICLHQLRLMFGGTRKRPLTVHGSFIDDFENFRTGSNADNAINFTLSARESSPIQWMASQKKSVIVGTASGELEFRGSSDEEALGPTNIESVNQSAHGSAHLQALLVNEVLMFVQRQGKKMREYAFDFARDGWQGPDLTVLASHIAGAGSHFVQVCFQQLPDATVWAPISSGEYIAAMTYEREQNVVGWHRHTTEGVFESCASVFGGANADEVWFAVKREVGGQTVRYIERLHVDHRAEMELEDKAKWWYLDAGIRTVFGTDTTHVTGLGHLEGKTVSMVVDGAVQPDRVVTGGSIELEFPGKNVLVGLRYRSVSKPSKFNLSTRDGTVIGRPARVHRSTFRLYKSLGLEFSSSGNGYWIPITFRKDGDPMDASPPAFTGDKTVAISGPYQPAGEFFFRDGGPYPLNILAVVPEFDFHGS